MLSGVCEFTSRKCSRVVRNGGEVCSIIRKCACKHHHTHMQLVSGEVKEKHKKKYFYDLSADVCGLSRHNRHRSSVCVRERKRSVQLRLLCCLLFSRRVSQSSFVFIRRAARAREMIVGKKIS